MSDHDTMRWGDTQSILLTAAASSVEGAIPIAVSKQMLNAKWERPVVWRLMVSIATQIGVDDAAITFDVLINLQVGVGQANQIVPLALVHFATPFASSIQFFDVPAEAMQLNFQIGNVAGGPIADPSDSVTVTAMCAPHAEPGSIAMMRNAMHAATHVESPDSQGLPRWMPEGFDDGELRYRR
jgi:hypothetical protein